MSNERSSGSTGAVIAGAALVALGLWFFFARLLNLAPSYIVRVVRVFAGAIGPLALIALGILVIVMANRGAFSGGVPDVRGRRLTRSRGDRMLAGVLGGLASYLDTDPALVRIAYVLVALVTGFWFALVAYVVAAILLPEEPLVTTSRPSPPTEGTLS